MKAILIIRFVRPAIAVAALSMSLWCGAAHAQPELLSIRLPSVSGQFIDGFQIHTWGVRILAICHVPEGWRLTGGNFVDPEGILSGETREGRPPPPVKDFTNLFLVEVYRYQANAEGPNGEHPATFAGSIHVGPFGDRPKEHDIPLTSGDFRRSPADRCPQP